VAAVKLAGRLLCMSRNFRRWSLLAGAFFVLMGLWRIYRGVVEHEGTTTTLLGCGFLLFGLAYAWIMPRQMTVDPQDDDRQSPTSEG
jgi:hypothetical protein